LPIKNRFECWLLRILPRRPRAITVVVSTSANSSEAKQRLFGEAEISKAEGMMKELRYLGNAVKIGMHNAAASGPRLMKS